MPGKKIIPCLWIDDRIEEMVNFYVATFKDAEIRDVSRYPDGRALTMHFRLKDQEFMALNGGPEHKFSLALSLLVNCKNQKEVDALWKKLSAGGKKIACGWLTDKFGVAWQITPTILLDYINDKNPTKAKNVMQAMMKMQKIDINRLKQAYRKQ